VERIVYYNGVFAPVESITISPFNRGLLYGDGLFETLRSYGGRVFRLAEHLKRLADGMKVLRIEHCLQAGDVEQAVYELLSRNRLSDASIRITVFRGDGEGFEPHDNLKPLLLIIARPFAGYRAEDYAQGFRAHIVSPRRNTYSPLSRIKSSNYLENILGRLEAREHNAQEALFLNSSGWVAEAAAANIFMIKDNVLITPPVDTGILPGITRAAVIDSARSSSREVREQVFSPEELLRADEAFLTSSLIEIMPLVMVQGRPVGSGLPGPLAGELHQRYRELVQQELRLSR
jgi:branched-chain amino acid aminotransferase group I